MMPQNYLFDYPSEQNIFVFLPTCIFKSCIIIHVVSKDIPLCLQKKKNAFPSAKDTGQPGSLFNHLLLRMPAGRSVLVGGMTDTLRLSGTPEVGPLWGSSTSALTSCYMLLQGCPLGTSTHQSPLIHPNGPGVPVSVTS